jgi:hypothetical protein
MAGKSLPSTNPQCCTQSQGCEHSFDRCRCILRCNQIPVTLARSGQQYSRMGRLDNPGLFHPADSLHDDPPNKYVPDLPSLYNTARADHLPIVTFTGLGRDIWTIEFDNITMMLKYFYFDQYIYQLIIVVTKISIVLLYLRIFPKNVSPRFSYVSWAIIAGLVSYCIGFLVYCG